MKLYILCLTTILTFIFSLNTFARDEVGDYSIVNAMSSEKANSALGSDIRFYFGTKNPGTIEKKYGTYSANKKTNAFNKTDEGACNWAFLSAMKSLKNRAMREGGNAVINIKSNYRDNETTSNKTFKCGAGNVVAGVALKGTVVKLK